MYGISSKIRLFCVILIVASGTADLALAFTLPLSPPPEGNGGMSVDSIGENVGLGLLGVTSAKLHINAGTGDALRIQLQDLSTALIIKSGGNVGINTANPTEKLEVAGNVKVSGSITAAKFYGDGGQLNGVAGTIPSGMIVAFDRACPSGWTYFSGLEGRFPLGASTYGSQTYSVPGYGLVSGASDIGHVNSGNANYEATGAGGSGTNVVGWAHQHPSVQPPPFLTVIWCRKN